MKRVIWVNGDFFTFKIFFDFFVWKKFFRQINLKFDFLHFHANAYFLEILVKRMKLSKFSKKYENSKDSIVQKRDFGHQKVSISGQIKLSRGS